MTWIIENAALLLTAAVVGWLVYALVRALTISATSTKPSDFDETARAEQVKREIQRTIADRRANPLPPRLPTPARPASRWSWRGAVKPIDAFGGGSARDAKPGWISRLRARLRRKSPAPGRTSR